jgi:hypothetical protein
MSTKPVGYWLSSSTPAEKQAVLQIEEVCGSFLQNLSKEAKYKLICEVTNKLPSSTISLNPRIQESIKNLSVNNLLNLMIFVAQSLY